jgi:hypothetical protein
MEWAYDGWGDFNLVRCQGEKSNRNINFNHASLFSDWIDNGGLLILKIPVEIILGLITKEALSWPD